MRPVELTLAGAELLLGGALEQDTLSLSDGVIVDRVVPKQIDARGFRILPGIVDIKVGNLVLGRIGIEGFDLEP